MYYWVHLEKTPITHRRRFVMFTREQVESLIEAEKDMINKMISGKGTELPATHNMYQKVASVASQIITKNMGAELEGFKWTLHVVDDPNMVNAVCLPSGEIFVFTGLVYACHNIDELALILSHEIAHAVLGHGLEVLSSRAVVDFFSLFVVGLIWSVMPFGIMASVLLHILSRRTADVLIHFPHSRKLEIEADSVGLIMAARACYDPIVAIKVWEHLPGSLTSVSTRTPEWNAGDKAPQGGFSGDKAPQGGFSGDKAPQGGFSGDKAPQGGFSGDKAPQGGFSGDKAPQGGFSGDKAPQGGYSGDKAPQGGFSGDKAPQGGLSGDKAPQGGFSGDKAPQGGLSGDKAPQGGFSGDKAPQGGFSGDKAPQGGFSGDKAPQGGFSGDKATQGGSSGDEAPPGGSSVDEAMLKYLSVHPSNTQRYENLVLLLPEAELVYQNSNCTVEFTNIFS